MREDAGRHRNRRTLPAIGVRKGRVIASAATYVIDGLYLDMSAVAAGTAISAGMFQPGCANVRRLQPKASQP
jgi:hypothetical protein